MQEQAQTKVFATPELLEIILLHLDTRTLLVSAQRVCQTWTAQVQSSPAIQEALFFRPARKFKQKKGKWHPASMWNSILPSGLKEETKTDPESMNGDKSTSPCPIYNPLLVQAFRPFFPSVHEYPAIYDNTERATETETEQEGKRKNRGDPFSFKSLDMFSSPQKKTAYMRNEASWRKMHLRQPPVSRDITVFRVSHSWGGDRCNYYKVPKGLPKTIRQQDRVHDDGKTLKMGHFFTKLVQNPDLSFGHWSTTHVYWSAHVPPCDPRDCYPPEYGSFKEPVKKEFTKAMDKSEAVLFTTVTVQCTVGDEIELTEDEILQEEIVQAETERSQEGNK